MNSNLGTVTKQKDGFQVRLERVLPFPIEIVWDAITNPHKLAMWFTDIEMDFVPEGQMTLYFRDADKTKSFGKIVRIDPPNVFEFIWEDELATWELTPIRASHCKLTLTYSKLIDKYAISVPAGWHLLLNQLETILQGRTEPYPFGGEETEASKKLKALYADMLSKQFPELKATV